LRQRRLVTRLGVVVGLAGEELPFEQVPVPLEVRLRELQVGFALTNRRLSDLEGRFLLADLLADLAVLYLGDRLAASDRIAEPHADRLQASVYLGDGLDGGGADEIAYDRDSLRNAGALDRRELDRHRRTGDAATAAGPTRTPARALRLAAASGQGCKSKRRRYSEYDESMHCSPRTDLHPLEVDERALIVQLLAKLAVAGVVEIPLSLHHFEVGRHAHVELALHGL
jgi:hypothetical protein